MDKDGYWACACLNETEYQAWYIQIRFNKIIRIQRNHKDSLESSQIGLVKALTAKNLDLCLQAHAISSRSN